jgi:hypothetical protein
VKSLRYVFGKIRAVLDKKEFRKVSKVVLLDVNEPFIEELQDFLEDYNNPSVFSNVEINEMSFKTGYLIVSPLNYRGHDTQHTTLPSAHAHA